MGRPKGSQNRVIPPTFDPERHIVQQDVLSQLKASLDARIHLFDSGRCLIDLCYPGLMIYARHHKQLFTLDETDMESLEMEDFPPENLGKGFKTAVLDDVLALPNTKRI